MRAFAVRPIAAEGVEAVVALHADAFAASQYGHNGEADLVRALHEEGDVLVSLGAWEADALVGHVLFSPMTVAADGAPIFAVALAPVAVLPAHRGRGVAATLIRAGHDAATEQGVRLSFVLGDPAYYGRFGYEVGFAEPFASPYAGAHFMACPLDSAVPRPQRGVAIHAPAFARLA
jgi:putative acetyltransferase